MTTVGLVACASLEQAPLVYSSKNQIGVGVSAGAPDSPGLDITIGYKALDAAYVPVAVSKPCPENSTCDSTFAKIEIIRGDNEIKGSEKAELSNIERLYSSISLKNESIKTDEVELSKLQNIKIAIFKTKEIESEINTINTRITSIENLAEINRTDDQKLELLTSNNRLNAIKDESKKLGSIIPTGITDQKIDLDIEKIDSRIKEDKKIIDALSVQIKSAEQRLGASAGGKRVDGYSVFGSFTGNTNASVTPSKSEGSAGLSLGKLFSTGVAAQFLSERVGESYVLGQRSFCVAKFEKTAEKQSPADAKKTMSDAIAFCMGSIKEADTNP